MGAGRTRPEDSVMVAVAVAVEGLGWAGAGMGLCFIFRVSAVCYSCCQEKTGLAAFTGGCRWTDQSLEIKDVFDRSAQSDLNDI